MGTEEQKQTFIKPTIEADMIWCQGYSEPGAGSDLAVSRLKPTRWGRVVINGQKIWTSTAHLPIGFSAGPNRTGSAKTSRYFLLLFRMDTPWD